MPKRWTIKEENEHRKRLRDLYVKQNKTIAEVGEILGIAEQTVFERLKRLDIPPAPYLKRNYLNKRSDISIPKNFTADLAEFFGIMLGDGGITHFQIIVTLGNKEASYAEYVRNLINKIFNVYPKVSIRKTGHRDIYLGSVDLTSWLIGHGFAHNKVRSQVDVPKWIFSDAKYMRRFLRGFFDTDGSVYKIRFGIQISLCNKSRPLLESLRKMLINLQFKPSGISSNKIYLTRADDVQKFFEEIKPQNSKHQQRFHDFIKQSRR